MCTHALTGIHVPLVTPFGAGGEVAAGALEALAHEVLDAGAAGIVALGTTAEVATLDRDERATVVDVCARVCRARGAGLIVGAGGNDTAATARALHDLHTWPQVSAALVPVPPYTRPGEEGVVAHFTALTATSPLPLVVYNIPYRTGQVVGVAALRRIAALDGIAGIKHAVGGVDTDTVALLAEPPDGLAVLAGDDVFASALLALGAVGGILASAHVCTAEFVSLDAAWRSGDVARARALGNRLAMLSAALFAEPSPAVIKAVLHTQGRIPSAAVRLPVLPASTHATARAVRRAAALGV